MLEKTTSEQGLRNEKNRRKPRKAYKFKNILE